jgi:hypothetical protein
MVRGRDNRVARYVKTKPSKESDSTAINIDAEKMNITELLDMYENNAEDLILCHRAIHHIDLSEQYIDINTRSAKYLNQKLALFFYHRRN